MDDMCDNIMDDNGDKIMDENGDNIMDDNGDKITDDTDDNITDDKGAIIVPNGTNDLMCAVCFAEDGEATNAVGICKVCKFYLCRKCVTSHQRHEEYKTHHIAFFFCAQRLRANRYVSASSFCLDCGQYLCNKCVMDHAGYRGYRRHTFIGGGNQQMDDIPMGYKQTPPSRSARRPKAKSAQMLNEQDDRKLSISTRPRSSTPIANRPKHSIPKQNLRMSSTPKRTKPKLDSREPLATSATSCSGATIPRTLIHSNVGKHPDGKVNTNAKPIKRPKSVTFEEEIPKAKLDGEYLVKSSDDERPTKIIAMVYLLNETLAMADAANKNIKLFDKQCNYFASFKLEKLPISICASESSQGEMYVSSGNQIHKIETEPDIDILLSFETRIPRIEGITRWTSGIAAIFRSAKSHADTKGHWEVHLMSKEGIVKFIVAVSTPLEVRLVTPIWYISSTQGGDEIFISDTYNNRILCIDIINWQVVYVIKGKETAGSPRSIATDTDGNALVVWYGDVHTLSPTGEDLGVAVSDIGRTSVIAYNQRTETLAVWSDKRADLNKFRTFRMA